MMLKKVPDVQVDRGWRNNRHISNADVGGVRSRDDPLGTHDDAEDPLAHSASHFRHVRDCLLVTTADHTDYVELLATALKEINAKVGELFVKTEHPGLHLPVVNTVGEYTRAHKELYKLVGADNLQEDGLKKLLLAKGCAEQEFLNDGGRPKGKWALFKLLAGRTGLDWVAFDVVAENRIVDSHKMESTSAAGEYYPARFREDLNNLIGELRKLL
jgi:hypothetical protein